MFTSSKHQVEKELSMLHIVAIIPATVFARLRNEGGGS
jgi:hypothetical protein